MLRRLHDRSGGSDGRRVTIAWSGCLYRADFGRRVHASHALRRRPRVTAGHAGADPRHDDRVPQVAFAEAAYLTRVDDATLRAAARSPLADTAHAIGSAVASVPRGATRARASSTVDVALGSVLDAVRTGRGLAELPLANAAAAIRREHASLAREAPRAGAPTIDGGLASVQHAIVALRYGAPVCGADAALTVDP